MRIVAAVLIVSILLTVVQCQLLGLSADNKIFQFDDATGAFKTLVSLKSLNYNPVTGFFPTVNDCYGLFITVNGTAALTEFCLSSGRFSWPYKSLPSSFSVANGTNITIFHGDSKNVIYFYESIPHPIYKYTSLHVYSFDYVAGVWNVVCSHSEQFHYPPLYPSYANQQVHFIALQKCCGSEELFFFSYNMALLNCDEGYSQAIQYSSYLINGTFTVKSKSYGIMTNVSTGLYGVYLMQNGSNFLLPNPPLVVNIGILARQGTVVSSIYIAVTNKVYLTFQSVHGNFMIVVDLGVAKVVAKFNNIPLSPVSLVAPSV